MADLVKVGNAGPRVRSDCFIQLELSKDGGIQLDLKSRVASLYQKSITELVYKVFEFFGIEHAKIQLVDKGALPWVISARLESAIKKATNFKKEFLPDFNPKNKYSSARESERLTRLYLPGNTPSMFLNAGLHKPNAIILDLEDAVAPEKKDEARILVRNTLRACDFYNVERMVRINQGKRGLIDLDYVIPHNVHLIIIPKVETEYEVQKVEAKIAEIRKRHKIEKKVFLMPIIESALGVERAFDIANSSDQIVAMAIGLEDYTADIGAQRTHEGLESIYARSRVINAAHAAKIQPIDSVFSDIEDMEALLANAQESKARGFVGMGCIHPRQIDVVRKGFAPNEHELDLAKQVVCAANKAESQGLGVVALGSKMIDAPVVKRHKKHIKMALKLGLLSEDWEGKM